MHRNLVAGLALLASGTVAQAEPPNPWTGPYIGIHGGYAKGTEKGVLTYNDPAFPGFTAADVFSPVARSMDAKGWLGGMQAGYNYQTGPLVVGVEADMAWVDAKGAMSATSMDTFTTWNVTSRLHSLGTLRGRLGVAAGPVLFYATAGGAWARIETDNAVACVGCPVYPWAQGTSNSSHLGWTGGGGIEWMLGEHVTIKAEYLFTELGSATHNFVGTALSGTKLKDPNIPGIYDYRSDGFNHDLQFQAIRAGINLKF